MKVMLAIEMSQRSGNVALSDRDGRIDSECISPQKRSDDDFMPAVDRLFRRMKLAPRDLNAVGVSIGPGGFTGLRIAVSAAKMLAETLKVDLIAAPSALVAAESIALDRERDAGPNQVLVMLASKHESTWCTQLHRDGESWRIIGEPGLRDARSLELKGVELVLSDEHLPSEIRRRCDAEGIRVLPPEFDARACLAVAHRMLEQGSTIDPLRLLPLYPREPEAVSLWKQRKANA